MSCKQSMGVGINLGMASFFMALGNHTTYGSSRIIAVRSTHRNKSRSACVFSPQLPIDAHMRVASAEAPSKYAAYAHSYKTKSTQKPTSRLLRHSIVVDDLSSMDFEPLVLNAYTASYASPTGRGLKINAQAKGHRRQCRHHCHRAKESTRREFAIFA